MDPDSLWALCLWKRKKHILSCMWNSYITLGEGIFNINVCRTNRGRQKNKLGWIFVICWLHKPLRTGRNPDCVSLGERRGSLLTHRKPSVPSSSCLSSNRNMCLVSYTELSSPVSVPSVSDAEMKVHGALSVAGMSSDNSFTVGTLAIAEAAL